MSVPKGKRKDSQMEFIILARQIEEKFIDLRIHKPKRYEFFADRLLTMSMDITNHVTEANFWKPENQIDAQHRMNHWRSALAECYSLVAQIDIIQHKVKSEGISAGDLEILAHDIKREIALIKGIITSDIRRFSSLPVFNGVRSKEQLIALLNSLPVNDPNMGKPFIVNRTSKDYEDDWIYADELSWDLSAEAKTTSQDDVDKEIRDVSRESERREEAILSQERVKTSDPIVKIKDNLVDD